MRGSKTLTAKEVQSLADKPGDHGVGGAPGTLVLRVKKGKSGLTRSWVFVVRSNKQSKSFGLGAYAYGQHVIPGARSLKEARDEALRYRQEWDAGRDPRESLRGKLAQNQVPVEGVTVGEVFQSFLVFYKKLKQWTSPKQLELNEGIYRNHIAPHLGGKLVNDVTPDDVAKALLPKVEDHSDIVKKVKGLLNPFFRWCLQPDNGYRRPELGNPATAEALKDKLPKMRSASRNHYAMCPLADLPRFVRLLVENDINNVGGMACLFEFLTASRQGNVTHDPKSRSTYVVWDDFDLGKGLWVVSAGKMKIEGNGDHAVPLSRQAMAILHRLEVLGLKSEGAVFKSRRGSCVTETACRRIIKKLAAKDKEAGGSGFIDKRQRNRIMTMHGTARAAFQTWAAEHNFNREWTEAALHHAKGGMGEAYLRTDYIEQRRQMMQAWADFLFSECPEDWAEIKR